MGSINLGRVLAGGLLAGLVMNISEFVLNGVVLASSIEAATAKLNLPPPTGSFIAVAVGLTFVTGIVVVALYAAMRPRFGPGPRTAVLAGLAVWFFIFVHKGVLDTAMGLFPADLTMIALGWGLVEMALAAIAGAWAYREAPGDELAFDTARRASAQ